MFVAPFAGAFKLGGMSGVNKGDGGGEAGRAAAGATLLDALREARGEVLAADSSRWPAADRDFAQDVRSPNFRLGHMSAVIIEKTNSARAA
jgi:hypothetical protein